MCKPSKKKITLSVTNDLVTDRRVHKIALSLIDMGAEVTLVGRKLKNSLPIENKPYKTCRMKLLFKKGALFYAEYNIRLFFLLLFLKTDILVSNDLDTLLANYLVSFFRKKELVYDSHEYFTGVPEIQNRAFVKRTWEKIEKWIFPKLKTIYTVNQSIADLYNKQHNKNLSVVRNISPRLNLNLSADREKLDLPNCRIIILQGSGINMDRGGEEAVEAMQYIENALFLIVGSGDVIPKLKKMTKNLGLENKVKFVGKVPYEKLMQYTACADLGLSLDKDTNINYRFSLPNKIFDYIQTNTPILASNLVEIARIIKDYDIGEIIKNHNPKHIAEVINSIFSDKERYEKMQKNLKKAASELCWEEEEKVLKKIYQPLFDV